jgi:uncharacterized DUF497 family protein
MVILPFNQLRVIFSSISPKRRKHYLSDYYPDHSSDVEWYIDIGSSSKRRLIVVSCIERGEKIRIISSR